jgi:hypothetical protein
MPDAPAPVPAQLSRREKLLRQEVLACDDPICCCEAEPRWLRLQHEADGAPTPSEWESLTRPPCDEL